jgi:hypothetical protein
VHQLRKEIIRYALEFNILDICTYAGYRGDLLVKITVFRNDLDTPMKVKVKAEQMGMEVVIKDNKEMARLEVYCIIPDEDIYDLKI